MFPIDLDNMDNKATPSELEWTSEMMLMWARYYQLMDEFEEREDMMARAAKDGSDAAKEFIRRERINEFASLREMKVILKDIKGKIYLEHTREMEDKVARYEIDHGRINTKDGEQKLFMDAKAAQKVNQQQHEDL